MPWGGLLKDLDDPQDSGGTEVVGHPGFIADPAVVGDAAALQALVDLRHRLQAAGEAVGRAELEISSCRGRVVARRLVVSSGHDAYDELLRQVYAPAPTARTAWVTARDGAVDEADLQGLSEDLVRRVLAAVDAAAPDETVRVGLRLHAEGFALGVVTDEAAAEGLADALTRRLPLRRQQVTVEGLGG